MCVFAKRECKYGCVNWSKIFLFCWFNPQEVKRRFSDGLPLLDPVEDMGIKDEGLKTVVRVCVYCQFFTVC